LLVVFTGVTGGLPEVVEALGRIAASGWSPSIYLSPWARAQFDPEVVRSIERLGRLLSDEEVADAAAAASAYDAVLVGTLSRNLVAKVALLATDSTAGELVLQALLAGKTVVAAGDGLEAETAHIPAAAKSTVQGYLRTLTEMGMDILPAAQLAERFPTVAAMRSARRGGSASRTIVTADEVADAARAGKRALEVPADAIITGAAEDRARELGVELRRV